MERKQIILIAAIVVFGLGSYLAITISSGRFENSYCGRYKSQFQDEYYQECLQADKILSACESEAMNKAWEEIQGMAEEECEKKIVIED